MRISVSEEEARVPITVLHVEGELSAASYEELQKQAEEAINAGARNLVLDLSDVTFLSSSGLRAIHHIFELLRSDSPAETGQAVSRGLAAGTYRSPHFKLLSPRRDVLQVLSQAGYDMFLEVHSDLRGAISSF